MPSVADADGAQADRALGLPPGTLATAPNGNRRQLDAARRMNALLWPATWGYFLGQMMAAAGGHERLLGTEPLARITATGVDAVDPQLFGIGPVEAVRRALAKAGRRLADVTTMELNEAFAAQSLACLSEWTDLDRDVVNPYGGAIAIGHPLGCSGARLAGQVAHQLATAGSGVGVAALCVGVGQGLALAMER